MLLIAFKLRENTSLKLEYLSEYLVAVIVRFKLEFQTTVYKYCQKCQCEFMSRPIKRDMNHMIIGAKYGVEVAAESVATVLTVNQDARHECGCSVHNSSRRRHHCRHR